MRSSVRKFTLTWHIALSVGWIGAVSAYLVLVIAAMASDDARTLRAAWIALELIGWYVIVPLALVALLTGLVMALGTPWGLFRHYWVLMSLVLTVVAAGVLVLHMPTVSAFARVAAEADGADLSALQTALAGELLHAGFGLIILLAIEALNVYKPRGLTAYGRRQAAEPAAPVRAAGGARVGSGPRTAKAAPRWAYVVGLHAIALALLYVIVHLTSGGLRHH